MKGAKTKMNKWKLYTFKTFTRSGLDFRGVSSDVELLGTVSLDSNIFNLSGKNLVYALDEAGVFTMLECWDIEGANADFENRGSTISIYFSDPCIDADLGFLTLS